MQPREIMKRRSSLLLLLGLCLLSYQFCLAQAQSPTILFAVNKDGKSGFIDNTGKIVIPLQFDSANGFSEGLALVTLKGKQFFIDTSGRTVFQAKFDIIRDFSEGLAAVNIGEKRIPNEIGRAHV